MDLSRGKSEISHKSCLRSKRACWIESECRLGTWCSPRPPCPPRPRPLQLRRLGHTFLSVGGLQRHATGCRTRMELHEDLAKSFHFCIKIRAIDIKVCAMLCSYSRDLVQGVSKNHALRSAYLFHFKDSPQPTKYYCKIMDNRYTRAN